jgi:hypothetical protein
MPFITHRQTVKWLYGPSLIAAVIQSGYGVDWINEAEQVSGGNGIRAVFHRPHPDPKADRGAVKSMKRFLTEAGIQP